MEPRGRASVRSQEPEPRSRARVNWSETETEGGAGGSEEQCRSKAGNKGTEVIAALGIITEQSVTSYCWA